MAILYQRTELCSWDRAHLDRVRTIGVQKVRNRKREKSSLNLNPTGCGAIESGSGCFKKNLTKNLQRGGGGSFGLGKEFRRHNCP